jgi:hypothetical protein
MLREFSDFLREQGYFSDAKILKNFLNTHHPFYDTVIQNNEKKKCKYSERLFTLFYIIFKISDWIMNSIGHSKS